MNYDDDLEFPKGDFISGIYNYCDRWCERCLYVDKCMNYAHAKIIEREVEAEKNREKSINENQSFWAQVNKTVEKAAELIDEEMPLIKKDGVSIFGIPEIEEEIRGIENEHKKIREKAKDDYLSKVAFKYEEAVDKWFVERKDVLKIESHNEKYSLKINYPKISNKLELEHISESVEIINWYHIQIWIKLQRALSGYLEEIHDDYLFKDIEIKDSDGSAFVALLGIDRSIGAWNYLQYKLLLEMDSIKPLIRMLLWLRLEVEKTFPEARSFVWPPKL